MFARSVDIFISLPSLPISQGKSKAEVSEVRLENIENVLPSIPTCSVFRKGRQLSLEKLEGKSVVEEHKNYMCSFKF